MTSSTATIEDTLHGAIVGALSELTEIRADEEADTGTYKYKYASLAGIMRTVRPVLASHGLVVSQLVSATNGELTVGTSLVHRSGQSFQSGVLSYKLPNTPQQLGSIVSYLRRYQLVALLGLAVEDDDGARGSQGAPGATGGTTPPRRTVRPSTGHRGTSTGNVDGYTDQQRRKIMALFGELGMSGTDRRDDRLSLTAEILGRDIDSTNDLTRSEAGVLIEDLENRADALIHDQQDPRY